MTKNFDEIKEKAFKIYNEFMNTLSNKDKVAITRCISSMLYAIDKNYTLIDPLEIVSMFRISYPAWYNDIKTLFRQYYSIVNRESVNYCEVSRKLELERYETPEEIGIISIVSFDSKNKPAGRINYNENDGLFVVMIPKNNIILSTFIVAHEIAHLITNKLGIYVIEGDSESKEIAVEMVSDYFAVFVYCRLTHITDKKQKENLLNMLKTIAQKDDGLYESNEMQIRQHHISQIVDTIFPET